MTFQQFQQTRTESSESPRTLDGKVIAYWDNQYSIEQLRDGRFMVQDSNRDVVFSDATLAERYLFSECVDDGDDREELTYTLQWSADKIDFYDDPEYGHIISQPYYVYRA